MSKFEWSRKNGEVLVVEAADEKAAKVAFRAQTGVKAVQGPIRQLPPDEMDGLEIVDGELVEKAEKPAKAPKAAKPSWRDLPDAEKAAFLLSHGTIADSAWTTETREKGEKRETFIARILGA